MAKVQITKQLADLIKSIRLENAIQSKELANHIHKSPAYISKLEKGEILSLEKEVLFDIFRYVTKGASNFDDMIQEVFDTLRFKYSADEINEQLWFRNFDMVERLIPIPEELIDEFNLQICNLNISKSYLLNRINANEALDASVCTNSIYPDNEWFYIEGDNSVGRFIKIVMSEQEFFGILDKTKTKVSYVFILAIAYYLIKIKLFGNAVNIESKESELIMNEAINLLNQYKFYSLSEKERLLNELTTPDDYERILNAFDRDNLKVINEILSFYKFWSERDIKNANTQFTSYIQNIKWDIGFMMKLISLNFNTLSGLNYTNKKLLIDEISNLILKYKNIPQESNNVEVY